MLFALGDWRPVIGTRLRLADGSRIFDVAYHTAGQMQVYVPRNLLAKNLRFA